MVDDTKSVHAFVAMLFSESGHELTHLYSGNEALTYLANEGKNVYDLILMDWEMPGLSGVETIKELRSMKVEIPILMITTRKGDGDMETAFKNGASAYLLKPFTKEALLQKIFEITMKAA